MSEYPTSAMICRRASLAARIAVSRASTFGRTSSSRLSNRP